MDVLYPHRKFSGGAIELAERAVDCIVNFGWSADLDKTNERLVRYYVAEGVIDRPERQGREVSYTLRHLLQLLTARRLVEAGLALSVIARHNMIAPTQALEDGLTEPIPTEAEILVNSFKSPDASRSFSPKFKAAQAPAPLSIPDVLHELKRMQADWMAEIGFVKKLRQDFELLKQEMQMHRSMAENAQQNFYKRFEKTAVTASEQHDYFMRQITQMIEKSQYEVNQVNQQLREVLDQRLDEMQRSQKRLIELVEGMQKDPTSNSSSATQS
jgi:DNA-binding transcriptional MerR regulator